MRVFGYLFCLLSLPLMATTEVTSTIYDIDYGQNLSDEVLILLTNGHVAKINQSQGKFFFDSINLRSKDQVYKITMDEGRYITKIKEINVEAPKRMPLYNKSIQDYVPTTIANMKIAKAYHTEARYNPKESQCFNRAMVWSYEWWKKHSLKSNKILIYFTRTYIRRYNFEWWFHIAPYVHVMHEGKVVERVMDIKYTRNPLEITKWANIFLRNDAPCPIIKKFSDYADYPYSGECFLQRTHMYTYQPADLQMYEAWGYKKENFIMDELRGAYLEAFDENI